MIRCVVWMSFCRRPPFLWSHPISANRAFRGDLENALMPTGKPKSQACGAWLFPDDIERLRELQEHLGGVSASEVFRRALERLYDRMTRPQ
jgi:hypothetical protein